MSVIYGYTHPARMHCAVPGYTGVESMPIVEYTCAQCRKTFERLTLQPQSGVQHPCPQYWSMKTPKVFSTFIFMVSFTNSRITISLLVPGRTSGSGIYSVHSILYTFTPLRQSICSTIVLCRSQQWTPCVHGSKMALLSIHCGT